MTIEYITALLTSIVGPTLAYLKVREDRLKTSEKRDSQFALIERRLLETEKDISDLQELKDSINRINVTLTRIETILEIYMKTNPPRNST